MLYDFPLFAIHVFDDVILSGRSDIVYHKLEIIIVDDFCGEDCAGMLEDYAKKDRRIFLIKNSQNMGLTKSLNTGLKYVHGTYIARMDSDDISVPDRIE